MDSGPNSKSAGPGGNHLFLPDTCYNSDPFHPILFVAPPDVCDGLEDILIPTEVPLPHPQRQLLLKEPCLFGIKPY